MPLLIGAGCLVGGMAALFGFMMLCMWANEEGWPLLIFAGVFFLGMAWIIGAGFLNSSHPSVPVWVWASTMASAILLMGSIFMDGA